MKSQLGPPNPIPHPLDTLGPCSVCEYHITRIAKGEPRDMRLYCDLCDGLTRGRLWLSANDPIFFVI
jgi:hypothetical protein